MSSIVNLKSVFTFVLTCLSLTESGFSVLQAQTPPTQINFDFRNGAQEWQAGFADYPKGSEDFYDQRAEIKALPSEILQGGKGLFIQGNNHSDDLFMFIKRHLSATDGIVAGQRYQLYFNVVLASNAQTGCGGIGGPQGEGVVLKAGASPNEPLSNLSFDGNLRMNVNIGNHDKGGSAATVIGNIANGLPCNPDFMPYVSIQRSGQQLTEVTATSGGDLWLLVGADSGFEGLTALYYQSIEVKLVPVGTSSQDVPVLLTEQDTGQGIAFDSVTMQRDPLPLKTTYNFSSDRRSRVMLFATGANLQPGEDGSIVSAQVEDVYGSTFPVTVEYVGKVPLVDGITQIIIRMPDQLLSQRMWVSISMRGATSNRVPVIVVSPPPS